MVSHRRRQALGPLRRADPAPARDRQWTAARVGPRPAHPRPRDLPRALSSPRHGVARADRALAPALPRLCQRLRARGESGPAAPAARSSRAHPRRGGLLAVLAAGVLLLASLARVRSRGWVLLLAGALGVVTIVYALWIGADPLLPRLAPSKNVGRLEQWRSSIPMLATFPVLGVGLGAYKDIYFRFQPVALLPGRVYFPYAHSDLLQFAIETGPAGVAIALWALWRVLRDLVGAHLLGRGRCPVAEGAHARRSDPFSVGIMLGALAAVVALGGHSAVDFSARIPADGILGAACLGIATVAAHTRFGVDGARSLVDIRCASLGGRRPRAAVGALVALVGACGIPAIVKQARADT